MNFIKKIKKEIKKSEAQIIQVSRIPGFIRIVAKTSKEEVLTPSAVGGYIKFMATENSKMKSITIASNTDETFTLDFVDHSGNGEIANYAKNAKIGDKFYFRGPGKSSQIDLECKRFLFIGDPSAYPAIKANIQKIISKNPSAKITLFSSEKNESFEQYFKGLQDRLQFIVGEVDFSNYDFLWFAGEKSQMQKMKQNSSIPDNHYISSYWVQR